MSFCFVKLCDSQGNRRCMLITMMATVQKTLIRNWKMKQVTDCIRFVCLCLSQTVLLTDTVRTGQEEEQEDG